MSQQPLTTTECAILANAATTEGETTTSTDVANAYTTNDQIRIARALALYISQH